MEVGPPVALGPGVVAPAQLERTALRASRASLKRPPAGRRPVGAVPAEPRLRRPVVDAAAIPVRPPATPALEIGVDPPRFGRRPSPGAIITGRGPPAGAETPEIAKTPARARCKEPLGPAHRARRCLPPARKGCSPPRRARALTVLGVPRAIVAPETWPRAAATVAGSPPPAS